MRNKEKDALEMARRQQTFLETGFRLFSEKGIEQISMNDIARASGSGIATLYRYYSTKRDLVVAIGVQQWEAFFQASLRRREAAGTERMTGAEEYAYFLERFIALYQENPKLLRFNQLFNLYVQSENVLGEGLDPYARTMEAFAGRFHEIYAKGLADGTLNGEIPEPVMYAATLHIMLAAVTRYAVGLLYRPEEGMDPVEELRMLKRMFLREFTRGNDKDNAG